MKALVIAPQPFYSPRGTPLSVYYRTLVMAELGVEVDLLTYGEGQDIDVPGVRVIRIPHLKCLGPVKVGPSFAKLFLDLFMILWTVGLLGRYRYDYVHAHEESVFWCRFLKPIFGLRLVYDMHSSLPQQLTNFNFTRFRMLIKTFTWLERTSLRSADAVITICPDLEEYALKSGVDASRHFLIENSIFDDVCVRDRESSDVQVAEEQAWLVDHSGPIVVYAGTFEAYQGLDLLIKGFKEVTRRRSDVHLLMVGGTPTQIADLKALADEVGLNNHCTFTGRVTKSRAAEFAHRADVLVSPRREGSNTPLKIYEQLASGKPLVATRIWSHTQVLSDDVCFLVDLEPSSIAEGIMSAIEDHSRRDRVCRQAMALYEARYSRRAYEAKMKHLVELLR